MEMIAAILYQLTRNLSIEEIRKSGFDTYFVDHTTGIYPVSAAGVPFSAAYLAVKGDLFADLHEDLAADGAIAQVQRSNKHIHKKAPSFEGAIFISIKELRKVRYNHNPGFQPH